MGTAVKEENNHRKKSIRTIVIQLLPIILMILIFVHSALPANISSQESAPFAEFISWLFHIPGNLASFIVRKSAHFFEYLVLGGSLFAALHEWMKNKKEDSKGDVGIGLKGNKDHSRILPFAAWAVGTVYSMTDELHQMFVPGRSCEFRDVCVDSAGVFAGVCIVYLIIKLKRKDDAKDPMIPGEK